MTKRKLQSWSPSIKRVLRGPVRLEVLPGNVVNYRIRLNPHGRILGARNRRINPHLKAHHWHTFPELERPVD